jgi:hypothetical protein
LSPVVLDDVLFGRRIAIVAGGFHAGAAAVSRAHAFPRGRLRASISPRTQRDVRRGAGLSFTGSWFEGQLSSLGS